MLHNKTVKMNMSVFEGKIARIPTKMFALDRQKRPMQPPNTVNHP